MVPGERGEMAENELPSITLRVKDLATFAVEVDFRVPNPEYALLMLETAKRAIEREIRSMEAAAAMMKMGQQRAAMDAMRKGIGLVKPE